MFEAAYDPTVTYDLNTVVIFNGVRYGSLGNGNHGNTPNVSPNHWSTTIPAPATHPATDHAAPAKEVKPFAFGHTAQPGEPEPAHDLAWCISKVEFLLSLVGAVSKVASLEPEPSPVTGKFETAANVKK